MTELGKKVKASIERLKSFYPKNGEGYYLAFSGGKDSVVCKALLDLSGLKYDAHYRVTSVDPPELVRFIRDKHPDVEREIPHYEEDFRISRLAGKPITMWNLIPWQLMPPTRLTRYCCKYLKESGGDGRLAVTGVRWAESTNRKNNQGVVSLYTKKAQRELSDDPNFRQVDKGGVVLVNDNEDSRRVVEMCRFRMKTVVNPIIEWTDEDVWEFIRAENIPYCGLYDCGYKRLGCIGCPMAQTKGRERDFLRYPKYKKAYLRAFDKMLQLRKERNMRDESRPVWRAGGTDYSNPTAMDVYNWWMEYDILPGQVDIFDLIEEARDYSRTME